MKNSSRDTSKYHTILGLEEGAAPEEIKKAYRQLCFQYHPDRAGEKSEEANELFLEITKAYRILIGIEKQEESEIQPTQQSCYVQTKKTSWMRWRNRKNVGIWGGIFLLLFFIVVVGSVLTARRQAVLKGLEQSRSIASQKQVPPPLPQREIKHSTPQQQESIVEQEEPKEENAPLSTEIKKDAGKHPIPLQEQSVGKNKLNQTTSPPPLPVEQQAPDQGIVEKDKAKEVLKLPEQNAQQKHTSVSTRKIPLQKSPVVENQAPPMVKKEEEAKILPEPYIEKEPEKQDIPQQDLSKKIALFLEEYTTAYEKRNVISFMRFFTEDAVENGAPIATTITSYEDFFQSAQSLQLQINLISWNKEQDDSITIHSRYQIDVTYLSGNNFSGKGGIIFRLRQKEDALLIQKLNYTLEENR